MFLPENWGRWDAGDDYKLETAVCASRPFLTVAPSDLDGTGVGIRTAVLGQVQHEERGAQSHGGQQPRCGKAASVSGLLVSWRTVSPYQGLNWGIPEHPDPVVWLASVGALGYTHVAWMAWW